MQIKKSNVKFGKSKNLEHRMVISPQAGPELNRGKRKQNPSPRGVFQELKPNKCSEKKGAKNHWGNEVKALDVVHQIQKVSGPKWDTKGLKLKNPDVARIEFSRRAKTLAKRLRGVQGQKRAPGHGGFCRKRARPFWGGSDGGWGAKVDSGLAAEPKVSKQVATRTG